MRPFRLQSVARLRNMEEERAAAELLRRRQFRDNADLRTIQADAALDSATLPAEADVRGWQAAVAARAAASAAAVEAATAAELAGADEAGARTAWSAARTRTATLTKLADRHRAAERAEANHSEQLVLDEIASQRAHHGGVAR